MTKYCTWLIAVDIIVSVTQKRNKSQLERHFKTRIDYKYCCLYVNAPSHGHQMTVIIPVLLTSREVMTFLIDRWQEWWLTRQGRSGGWSREHGMTRSREHRCSRRASLPVAKCSTRQGLAQWCGSATTHRKGLAVWLVASFLYIHTVELSIYALRTYDS